MSLGQLEDEFSTVSENSCEYIGTNLAKHFLILSRIRNDGTGSDPGLKKNGRIILGLSLGQKEFALKTSDITLTTGTTKSQYIMFIKPSLTSQNHQYRVITDVKRHRSHQENHHHRSHYKVSVFRKGWIRNWI